MKSLHRIGLRPVSLPLSADDIVEFHAARLLLLIQFCGAKSRDDNFPKIDSLTKLAKLDFFVRYPDFFEVARAAQATKEKPKPATQEEVVESTMVRHHYGPWDKRYYHILAYLEAKQLISVSKEGNSYQIALTEMGQTRAKALAARPSYAPIVERMKEVKKAFGGKSGNSIKKLIYEVFDEEVGRRPMGEIIKQ